MMEPSHDDYAGTIPPVGNKKNNAVLTRDGDDDGSKKKKSRRKVHSLPPELSLLTDRDRDKFLLVLEVDKTYRSATFGEEFLVAQSVTIPSPNGNISENRLSPSLPLIFDLRLFSVENLRKLCTCFGISNSGSLSKFNCRKAIAFSCRYQQSLSNMGIRPTSHASRVTSTVCRAVNVVFSTDFIEDFKSVNNRKSRQDHETRNTFKAFWIRAAIAHNSCMAGTMDDETELVVVEKATSPARNGEVVDRVVAERHTANRAIVFDNDDDSSSDSSGGGGKAFAVDNNSEQQEVVRFTDDFSTIVVFPVDDEHLLELVSDPDVNLLSVDQYETKAFTKKIMDLFKVRRKMKNNMTQSGNMTATLGTLLRMH